MKRIVIIIVYNDLNLLLQIFYIPCCTEYGELSSYILISFERIRFSTLLGDMLILVLFFARTTNLMYILDFVHAVVIEELLVASS